MGPGHMDTGGLGKSGGGLSRSKVGTPVGAWGGEVTAFNKTPVKGKPLS
jgi:hypothetical protein